MRRIVMTGAALAALLPAGLAAATTTPGTEPPGTAPADTMEPTASEPAAATETPGSETAPSEAVTVYDDSGNAVATITVTGSEVGWADYEEGEDPDAGNEYVQVSVNVASEITEGTFGVSVEDFILQSAHGFVTDAASVASAAQAESDEDITTEADLANGETVDLVLTFEVVASVGPQSVFYSPEDDRLVDVAELG